MQPCTNRWIKQKKTERSRLGVIQSWIVELHSKVPHILKNPAIKQVATSMGTLVVFMQIRLQAIIAEQQISRDVLEVKRNLSRNMIANVSAMPAMEAYPAIMISSCISAVEPTISLTAAK